MKSAPEATCLSAIKSLEIICVGTELLLGDTVNTNAAYLARQLAEVGVPCYYQTVVGDHIGRLKEAIHLACTRSGGAVLTGGLGPTSDDVTVQAIAHYFGVELKEDSESRKRIEQFFEVRNIVPPYSNFKQALAPEGALVFHNDRGTAPGGLIETDGKVLIWLPGPPSEMKPIFERSVKPILISRATLHIESVYIRLFGIGESAAEERIRDLIDKQTNPTIAPYCSTGECMFRITYSCAAKDEALSEHEPLKKLVKNVTERLGEYVYEIGNRSLPEVVCDLLRVKGKTLSLAESCTAGLMTSMIGEYSGASAFLCGSIIAYSNASKEKLLGIPPKIINSHGAVSKECAMEMAIRCRKKFGSDLAVSITGIAGPGGGSPEKPVGMVILGFSRKGKAFTHSLKLNGDRSRIRYIASLEALNMIRKELSDEG